MSNSPIVIVFSGKRKSGKDYISDLLQERLGGPDNCSLVRLSGPLKGQYAKDHGLDSQKLMDASAYKEKYRADMIRWGEEQRNRDPSYFCRLATQLPELKSRSLWVVTDARRKTDVAYFRNTFGDHAVFVRVTASEEVRIERGWVYTIGVDDVDSECNLDEGVRFDVVVPNDVDRAEMVSAVDKLVSIIGNINNGVTQTGSNGAN